MLRIQEDIMEDKRMGMMFGVGSMSATVTTIKDKKGASVGSIRVKKSSEKKLKKLQYNCREISTQILMAKTSGIASTVAVRARAKLASLQRKRGVGDYDSTELDHAIIHAKKMVRIARKRTKNLKEEERADSSGYLVEWEENQEKETKNTEQERQIDQNEEELKRMQEEYQEMMRELMKETIEESMEDALELDELGEELMGTIHVDMDPEDLERLKKKHRADELRQIMEANMKYLKFMMGRLEKEKQSGPSISAVSLQFSGIDMPAELSISEAAPAAIEGANLDISV